MRLIGGCRATLLYSFPVVAVRNYHKLGGLEKQKFILTVLEARNLKSRLV